MKLHMKRFYLLCAFVLATLGTQAQMTRNDYEIMNQDGLRITVQTAENAENGAQAMFVKLENTTQQHLFVGATNILLDALYNMPDGTQARSSRRINLEPTVLAPGTTLKRRRDFNNEGDGVFAGFDLKTLDLGEIRHPQGGVANGSILLRLNQDSPITVHGSIAVSGKMGMESQLLRPSEKRVYVDFTLVNEGSVPAAPFSYKVLFYVNNILVETVNLDTPASLKKREDFTKRLRPEFWMNFNDPDVRVVLQTR
jgi:hypothetical protein